MDLAGPAANRRQPLIPAAALLAVCLCCSLFGIAQLPNGDSRLAQAKQLLAEERWQELVALVQSTPTRSAELEFYHGTALARLGRWDDAHRAFQAGAQLQPQDKRFPIELAGVAFKQKRYPEAESDLRRALKLDPSDTYAQDFLGTIYFLQSNLEAALKYWNRLDKPQIAEIRSQPVPQLDPVLLDRAFIVSPASTLRLPELLTTQTRIQGLEIFPSFQFDLQAREDGRFDVSFNNRQNNGWGSNKWERLFRPLRGLPFQSVNPEYYNLGSRAANLVSMFRWDAEKRRAIARFSSPFHGNPQFRYELGVDLRNENWDIRDSPSDAAPLLASLNMRREAVSAGFTDFVSGRWKWSLGAELSHRDFRSVIPGVGLTGDVLAKGYQLKQVTGVEAELWRMPERRVALNGGVFTQIGRIWSEPRHSFLKLQTDLRLHWFPLPGGDDYEMQHQIRMGKTWGDVPFDELFTLGVERDNDLQLRGHVGTHHGRKGSSPLGRCYFLSNWEVDKNVYRNPLLAVKLGPFVDTGKITDASAALGSHEWLWDIGAQAKVRVLGVGVALSYGKDLRSGGNAYYVSLLR